jgi:hypothetical protein
MRLAVALAATALVLPAAAMPPPLPEVADASIDRKLGSAGM